MTFWLIVVAVVILIEVGHWLVTKLKAEDTPEKRKVSARRMKRLWVVDPALLDRVTVVPRRRHRCVRFYDQEAQVRREPPDTEV